MTPAEPLPALTLFARDPRPGEAKTRLAPALGTDGAARLALDMIGWTVDVARRHWPGPLRIAAWPAGSADALGDRFGVAAIDQRGADLGARMMNVLANGDGPGAVMGCDVPHVDGAVLERAAALLAAGRHVVGPAADGGFYLLGLVRPVPGLFDAITWGTGSVCERLRRNAARADAVFSELPTLRDIDTPDDLDAVARIFPPLARFAGRTGRTHHV